jgi:hypothetical protein
MGVDTATVDAGRVEGATGRGAGWEARVGAGAAAGAGARTGAGAAACGATRAGALTAGSGGSGAMGAGAGCEGRPSGAGDRLGGGGGAVGGWKPIMVGLCARATGRAEGRSGELTGAASSAGGGVEPTFTMRRDGSRRRWLRRGCGRRGDHRRPHVRRTAVHERRQRGHQVGQLVQLGLRHLARLASGQLQRGGPLLQRGRQHVHAEHLRRRVERLQPGTQLVARPRRLRAPNQESERATQLTRLLGEAVYEALACKPERSVMGSLRHGEVECTQLADRGQFPHIRAPLGRADAPSHAPLRRRLTPPHLPPRFRLLRGCNSVGRVPASHAGCRGFESHRPLKF